MVSLCLFCLFSGNTSADDAYQPSVAQASGDAALALEGFVLPEGMSGRLLAAEPMLANPVAFSVADDGRAYVCETFRQEVGVEDNRSHMNWLHNDLRLESVEERLAMFRRYLGDDVSRYATQHDRIRLLEDTDGDGTFDSDKVFAQGFNDILDGTGAGVIEYSGSVYYTCIPKLWRLQDTDHDGVADDSTALHHGYGVRVAFRGHDMHGLVIGPDGRLYFSIGDRGYNVITQEGTRLKRVDTGAVFRCDADGSHLEEFATGLRNPQELTFDDDGNLWTGDNNSDSGDQARWVYIVQDGDTGWRMYFQYEDDRGPWNRERMWYPYRADDETTAVQPAYIVPPIANLADGPSGLTFYPGLGLSDRYQDHFFMADFRGTAGNSGIQSFSVKSKGATFELTDVHKFIWSILGTDLDFAPDGSLFVSDWVNGWTGEGKGRLYRFADDRYISAVAGANVPQLLNGGIQKTDTNDLLELLGHADRRVRQRAQWELVRRDAATDIRSALETATDSREAATTDSGSPDRTRHLLWATWQLGLQKPDAASDFLARSPSLIARGDNTSEHAVRILTDLIKRHGLELLHDASLRAALRQRLVTNLAEDNLRLAGFSAVALGAIGQVDDIPQVIDLLVRNDSADPVIRHQCTVCFAAMEQRSPECLNPAARHSHSAVRKAVVVARRRNDDVRGLLPFLDDTDPDVVLEAARALQDECFGPADADILRLVDQPGLSSALLRRCLEAAYRIGTADSAAIVARIAAADHTPEAERKVAAEMLTTWNQPRQTSTVNGRWRPLPQRDVPGLDDAVRPHLPAMLAGPKSVREAAISIAAALGISDMVPALEAVLADQSEDDASRVAAFRALSALSSNVDQLLKQAAQDSSEGVRIASLEILAKHDPAAAVSQLSAATESDSIRTQQTAVQLLGSLPSAEAVQVLATVFDRFEHGTLSPAVALDLLKAGDTSGDGSLKDRVAAFRKQQASAGKVDTWSDCLEGGNADRGEQIFFGRASASCRRCHKVNGNGAEVGPDLSAVAKDRDRRYLLEAIVDPNAKIAKGFETTIIVDTDGRIHSGIIREETPDVVKLVTPQGAIISVATADIEDRAKGQSGMPADISKNLSRDDVRDLVEYLSALKVAKSTSHGEQ
ncbi:MAG: HEAT repeat domain-containing protein [Planctomycetaceae bacterium]